MEWSYPCAHESNWLRALPFTVRPMRGVFTVFADAAFAGSSLIIPDASPSELTIIRAVSLLNSTRRADLKSAPDPIRYPLAAAKPDRRSSVSLAR